MLPFLDIFDKKISKFFITSIYNKPTFTGLCLSWDSSASRKINLIKTFTHSGLMICSECRLDKELKKITDILFQIAVRWIKLWIESNLDFLKFNNKIHWSFLSALSTSNFHGLDLIVHCSPIKSPCLSLVALIPA